MVETSGLVGFNISLPFEEARTLDFFYRAGKKTGDLIESQVSIVYGANGAGKSSVAKGLRRADGYGVEFRYSNNQTIPYAPQDRESIFVFDDQFVHENVRTCDRGVEAFVMVGEQVSERDDLDAKLRCEREAREQLSAKTVLLAQSAEDKDAAFNEVKRSLRQNGSWAIRAKKIHGVQKNVTDQIARTVLDSQESTLGEVSELVSNFESKLFDLDSFRSSQLVEWKAPPYKDPFSWEDIDRIGIIPRKEVASQPGREKILARIDENCEGAAARKTLGDFLKSASACPRCLQDIDPSHAAAVIELIDLLSADAATAAAAENVRRLVCPMPKRLDVPVGVEIPNDVVIEYEVAFNDFVEIVSLINDELMRKADAMDTRLDADRDELSRRLLRLNRALAALRDRIDDHNQFISKRGNVISDLDRINIDIARIECDHQTRRYHESAARIAELKHEISDTEGHLKEAVAAVVDARSKLQNHEIARKRINYLMSLVYAGNRIELRPEASPGEGYQVYSNGNAARPGDLSTGERNILALCYFIALTGKGLSVEGSMGGEKIIVLDDPISSFDFDNKYGVMNLLLRFMKDQYLDSGGGRPPHGTKILLLTHDLAVACEIYKGVSMLPVSTLEVSGSRYASAGLEYVDFQSVDVYGETIRGLYDFAFGGSGDSPEVPFSLADVRRVYEAFVKFHLSFNIGDASTESSVRSFFRTAVDGGELILDAFRSAEYMNAFAHTGSDINNLNFDLRPPLSVEDIRQFVSDMLLFIHVLSPLHVVARVERKVKNQDSFRSLMDQRVEARIKVLKAS